jgi:DNA-binding CsgD family transcriptional regulator
MLTFFDPELAQPYFDEATDLARSSSDFAALAQLRAYQGFALVAVGEPGAAQAACEEGRDLADALGDSFTSRYSRTFLGSALAQQGKLAESLGVLRSLVGEARAAEDRVAEVFGLICMSPTLAFTGEAAAAQAAAEAALVTGATLGGLHEDSAYVDLAIAAIAAGDAPAARHACDAALRHTYPLKEIFIRSLLPMADAALGCGDPIAARRWADDTVAVATGFHRLFALASRARVALVQGERQQAENDLHDAIAVADRIGGCVHVSDAIEGLAALAADTNPEHAARLLGAADAIRQRHGEVRLRAYQAACDAALATAREALGQESFDSAYSEGKALSTAEAISYAQRGRGARRRPASGWESLTPAELDVVRLVTEGLPSKDIAARLFISPRTVQSHLTHIYTKLAVSSRVQLVHEAARHADPGPR